MNDVVDWTNEGFGGDENPRSQGRIIQLLPRTLFDFTSVPDNGSIYDIRLTQNVDVAEYTDLTVVCRLHPRSLIQTGIISVWVGAVAPTADEPNVDFIYGVPLSYTSFGGLAGGAFVPAPQLIVSPVRNPTPFAGRVSVFMEVGQGSKYTHLSAILSLDLVAKEA